MTLDTHINNVVNINIHIHINIHIDINMSIAMHIIINMNRQYRYPEALLRRPVKYLFVWTCLFGKKAKCSSIFVICCQPLCTIRQQLLIFVNVQYWGCLFIGCGPVWYVR